MALILQLFVCESFKPETEAILSSGGFVDVKPIYFKSRCNNPLKSSTLITSIPLLDISKDFDKMILGCSCMTSNEELFYVRNNIQYSRLPNCFQMFAPETLISKYLKDGCYLMTPDWLSKWRFWTEQWGNKDICRQMFADTVTQLVLINTGIDSNSLRNLKDFGEYIDRKTESFDIGLGYYRYYIENEILKWRLNNKNVSAENPLLKSQNSDSDYAMALDLLANMPRFENEEVLAKKIMEIFIMMFSAQKVHYLSVVDDNQVQIWSIPSDYENNEALKRLSSHSQVISMTASGKGFCINIESDNKLLAVIEADEILFNENLEKYKNLALAISKVFALSIENSRYYQHILKMNDTLKKLNSTKDMLFSIIGHDLRSPFNSFLGFTD